MITKQQILQWLEYCHQLFKQNQDYLTQLDREIGDSDHGMNMHRGFSKVAEKLPTLLDKDIGTILKTTGMTLLSQVGGQVDHYLGHFLLKVHKIQWEKSTFLLVSSISF